MKLHWRLITAPNQNYCAISWLYLRCLGGVALIAHLSLWTQAMGLFGSKGILPFTDRVLKLGAYGAERHWGSLDYLEGARSVLFWSSSDSSIHGLFLLGCLASLAVFFNRFTAPMLMLTWVCYTSLASAAGVFLQFQWDMLLLEMLLLGLLVAPWTSWRSWRFTKGPSLLSVTAHRALFFKLLFLSGAVKLLSQDEVWLNLTALDYHYWTQPIPHALGYFAHALPLWIQKLSCAIMFIIELVVPFLIFGPHSLRRIAFVAQLILQILILLTGNYGFFNLLAITASLFILDDNHLPSKFRNWIETPRVEVSQRVSSFLQVRRSLSALLCGFILIVHVGIVVDRAVGDAPPLAWISAPARWIDPLRLFHPYGLFASMTKERREIIVEGSVDGIIWKRYDFAFKPDAPEEMPAFINPHMPRLDWQMWFAALRRSCTQSRGSWYLKFVARLLENEETVTDLLGNNPFSTTPPKFIRAKLVYFQFQHRAGSPWWETPKEKEFCPTLQLVNGQLQRANL